MVIKRRHVAKFLTVITKGGVTGAVAGAMVGAGKPAYEGKPLLNVMYNGICIVMGCAAGASVPNDIGDKIIDMFVGDTYDSDQEDETIAE